MAIQPPAVASLREQAAAGAQALIELIDDLDTKLERVRENWSSLRATTDELRSMVGEEDHPHDR
jgi:hypothetical protein